MGEDFFNFAKTRDALSQMTTDLAVLESALKEQARNNEETCNNMQNDLSAKEEQLKEMKTAIQKAVSKIDTVTQYIDGVL